MLSLGLLLDRTTMLRVRQKAVATKRLEIEIEKQMGPMQIQVVQPLAELNSELDRALV